MERPQPKKPGNSVDHPAHYNMGNVEVIDAIESWRLGFSLGNAVKYIARASWKGKELEDLEKAAWYLNRHIEQLKGSRREEGQTDHPRDY